MTKTKKILITSGDPAGCGPYISLKSIALCKIPGLEFFLIGDACIYEKYPLFKKVKRAINFIDVRTENIDKLPKGVASKISGRASLKYLETGISYCKELSIERWVTAPVSKEAIQMVLTDFSGHTEFLAQYFRVKKVAMLMSSRSLNVVLLTRHIPLDEVSGCIKRKKIIETAYLAYNFFKEQRGLRHPRIAIAAVNPHAGIDTFAGPEEKKIIKALRALPFPVAGPYPADSLFIPSRCRQYDCIICAYHDQAMIPFKLLSFRDGVNVTLGLPVMRTSPAHGVAFDLVRQAKTPDHSSMSAAITFAAFNQALN